MFYEAPGQQLISLKIRTAQSPRIISWVPTLKCQWGLRLHARQEQAVEWSNYDIGRPPSSSAFCSFVSVCRTPSNQTFLRLVSDASSSPVPAKVMNGAHECKRCASLALDHLLLGRTALYPFNRKTWERVSESPNLATFRHP